MNYKDENIARTIVEDIKFLFDDGITSEQPNQMQECQIVVSDKVDLFVDVLSKIVQTRKYVERVVPENILPQALSL